MKLRLRMNAGIVLGCSIYFESTKDFGIEIQLFKWTVALER